MSDLERVIEYHKWLGDSYEIKDNKDNKKSLTVGTRDDWYYVYYEFDNEKLIDHYITE